MWLQPIKQVDRRCSRPLSGGFHPAQTMSGRRCSAPPFEGNKFSKRGQRLQRTISCQLKMRSEEHTSELQSPCNLVCRLLLEKKKQTKITLYAPYRQSPNKVRRIDIK